MANRPTPCECCGAPVGDDGRYESSEEALFIEEELERYEREAEPASVTDSLATLREKYPHGYPGSRPWWRHRTGHDEGCVICGGELPKNDRYWDGTPRLRSSRMYCSGACRQKAYRIRKKLEPQEDTDG